MLYLKQKKNCKIIKKPIYKLVNVYYNIIKEKPKNIKLQGGFGYESIISQS